MDAKDFFEKIVVPNYEDAINNPNDLRRTYNAIITVNTAAEFLALDKLGYAAGLKAEDLAQEANAIRNKHQPLSRLKYHADTMKHVRKLRDVDEKISATSSSTAFSVADPASWEDLHPELKQAMSVLRTLYDQCGEPLTF